MSRLIRRRFTSSRERALARDLSAAICLMVALVLWPASKRRQRDASAVRLDELLAVDRLAALVLALDQHVGLAPRG